MIAGLGYLPYLGTPEAHRRYSRRINFRKGWRAYPASGLSSEEADLLRGHERTGRPLGSLAFLKRIESRFGRVLRKKPPGRKPKTKKK